MDVDEPGCMLCGGPDPDRTIPVPSFPLTEDGRLLSPLDGVSSCEPCGVLVDARDWDGLEKRCAGVDGLAAAIRVGLGQHITGPAVPPSRPPHRVVDVDGDPWMCRDPYGPEEEALISGRPWNPGDPPMTVDQVVYQNDHSREVLSYATLTERHGPVRPVVAMPSADAERLRDLARAAGRKTLATIAAALYAVEMRLGAEPPRPARPNGLIHRDRLTAGRPGSWEASTLLDVIWVVGPTITGDRIDQPLMDAATEIFHRWATASEGYVEFAENIPVVLAPVIDDMPNHDAGIADDYLLYDERLMNWAGSLAESPGR